MYYGVIGFQLDVMLTFNMLTFNIMLTFNSFSSKGHQCFESTKQKADLFTGEISTRTFVNVITLKLANEGVTKCSDTHVLAPPPHTLIFILHQVIYQKN